MKIIRRIYRGLAEMTTIRRNQKRSESAARELAKKPVLPQLSPDVNFLWADRGLGK
jgi:hypothetical protein